METTEPRPPDELLAEVLASFAGHIEMTQCDPRQWTQVEKLLLLAQWLYEQCHATP
jgi:hypothetical protein